MIPVLHLRASAGLAGPERWLLESAAPLAARGFAVEAALLVRGVEEVASRALAAEAAARGLALATIADDGRLGRRAIAAAAARAAALGAPLLHGHDPKADWVALRAARRVGRPAVATVHLHTRATLALRLYRRIDLALLARFAAVIAVDRSVAAELAGRVAPERLHLVPNGLDAAAVVARAARERPVAARELAAAGPGPWILGVGRLVRQKGFDLLLEALAGAGAPLAPVRLALAGDGPERAALARHAERLGLAPRLLLLGDRREVAGFLAAADLVAAPSRREGLPFAALEALALGRPLVASGAGGLAALVVDGETGWRVAAEDPAALRSALAAALADPQGAAARGEAGRRLVAARHTATAMAAGVAEVYRRLLGPGAGP